jgi:lipid-binding SYLF domain-containing protein
MNQLRNILLAGLIAGFALPVAAEDLDKLIPNAVEIFGRFKREDLINMSLVKDAKGIVILNYTGFAIGIGGTGGDGILMARKDDGSWTGPCAITTDGGNIGIKVGGSDNDVVLLLMKAGVVNKWTKGDHFGSASASAVLGPKGADAVDASMRDRDFNAYVWNKGAELGVSFGGFDVNINDEANANYYDKPAISAEDIISGKVAVPESKKDAITRLYDMLK